MISRAEEQRPYITNGYRKIIIRLYNHVENPAFLDAPSSFSFISPKIYSAYPDVYARIALQADRFGRERGNQETAGFA